jgi:hypothetical protein
MPGKDLLITLKDLQWAVFSCQTPACPGNLAWNINNTERATSPCPVCLRPMLNDPQHFARVWREFHSLATAAKIQFRIKQPAAT